MMTPGKYAAEAIAKFDLKRRDGRYRLRFAGPRVGDGLRQQRDD
jgi:hypothetical protein